MKKNVGRTDRIIRLLIAIVAEVLVLTHAVKGEAAIALGMVAAIMLVTALARICPLYLPFKLSTITKRK